MLQAHGNDIFKVVCDPRASLSLLQCDLGCPYQKQLFLLVQSIVFQLDVQVAASTDTLTDAKSMMLVGVAGKIAKSAIANLMRMDIAMIVAAHLVQSTVVSHRAGTIPVDIALLLAGKETGSVASVIAAGFRGLRCLMILTILTLCQAAYPNRKELASCSLGLMQANPFCSTKHSLLETLSSVILNAVMSFLGRIRVGRRIHADAFRVLFDALMEELHDSHIQRLRCWGDEVHETSADQSVQTQIQKCVQLSRPFFERADQLQIWEELSSLSQEDLAARQLPEGDVNAQLQDFARMLKARFRAQRDDEHAFPEPLFEGEILEIPSAVIRCHCRIGSHGASLSSTFTTIGPEVWRQLIFPFEDLQRSTTLTFCCWLMSISAHRVPSNKCSKRPAGREHWAPCRDCTWTQYGTPLSYFWGKRNGSCFVQKHGAVLPTCTWL